MRDSYNSVGRCLLRLGRPEEAVGYLRRALPFAEDLVARQPVNSAAASMLAESKARLGEALLSLDQPGEALPLLEDALRRAEYLRRCDPPNPGFVQIHVVVLQSKVSGYLRWARIPSAAPSARAERLDRAQEALDLAEQLVADVASGAFRTLLHANLQSTADELREARVNGLLPADSRDQAR